MSGAVGGFSGMGGWDPGLRITDRSCVGRAGMIRGAASKAAAGVKLTPHPMVGISLTVEQRVRARAPFFLGPLLQFCGSSAAKRCPSICCWRLVSTDRPDMRYCCLCGVRTGSVACNKGKKCSPGCEWWQVDVLSASPILAACAGCAGCVTSQANRLCSSSSPGQQPTPTCPARAHLTFSVLARATS